MITLLWFLIFLTTTIVLAYRRSSLIAWTATFLAVALLHSYFSAAGYIMLTLEWLLFLGIAIPLNIPALRQKLITERALAIYRKAMPKMSRTEREALEAGTISWEGDLFSGIPNWQKLLKFAPASLSEEEQAFLNGPVEELCSRLDDWAISHQNTGIAPEIWQYLKDKGFFALIIPKQFGGKEFSATAHSAILTKIYSRCPTVGSVVAVPNSLGPAELLLHYGTDEQKNYYLPRLASGEEIPCFALTGPEAGSDASSIPDHGFVCRSQFEGKETLGIRLTWDKRYITLAPVATLLGLAFKLYDPDHLLGNTENLGITCALIPTKTPGVEIGNHHLPGGAPFPNGPTKGKDVFIPLDWIIGGPAMAGQGWRMLMECLAAGRAISLPAGALAGAKVSTFATGAYARIRKQFHQPIGFFEGIQEALARIGGFSYIVDAGIKFTMAALDRGEKPAVVSAIMKYNATELSRKIINDAMDIHGGKAICLGPRNYLATIYQSAPIGITVEGANILTRCLIIFGQGAFRCHPYLLAEFKSAQETNHKISLQKFDKAFFGHMGFIFSNIIRSLVLGLTCARWVKAPMQSTKRYYQKLTRYSTAFALCTDAAVLILGATLKRKEKLTARLSDIISLLYLSSAVLKQYADQGYPIADKPIVDWAMQTIIYNIQQSFSEFLYNFPNRWMVYLLQTLIFPLGKCEKGPRDNIGQHVAELLLIPNETRQRLTQGIYLTPDPKNQLALLNKTLGKVIGAENLEKRLAYALHEGYIKGITVPEQIASARAADILTETEAEQLKHVYDAYREVITVDVFPPEVK